MQAKLTGEHDIIEAAKGAALSLIVETLQLRPDDTPSLLEPKIRDGRIAKAMRYLIGSVELSPARATRWKPLARAAMQHFERTNPHRDVYHMGEYYDAADFYEALNENRGKVRRRTLAKGMAAVRAHRAASQQEYN